MTGFINTNGKVQLGSMYRVMNGTVSQTIPGDAAVRILDAKGTIVAEVPFTVNFGISADPTAKTTVNTAPFAFAVPFPAKAEQVQIIRNGQVLAQTSVIKNLLQDAVLSIPNIGFAKNPNQRREALLDKIREIQEESGEKGDERRELPEVYSRLKELRKYLADWLTNSYQTSSPREYTKAAILSLVDELLQRFKG